MSNIDEQLKDKAKSEYIRTPKEYDKKVENILKTLPKIKSTKKYTKTVAIAIVLTIVTTVSVIATPYIIELTGGAIDYFKDTENLKYTSDKPELEKYNSEVGYSITENEITFSIDNIAIDDNFMNIYYTLKSEKKLKDLTKYIYSPYLEYEIDGEKVQPNNTYHTESYLESDKELKVMERLNISHINIPEDFNLEVFTNEIFEKKGNWNISLNINTEEIKKDTNIVNSNIKATVSNMHRKHNINIEKVIMSPLGNQILISEKSDGLTSVFSMFGLQDDKGKFVDVYPGTIAYGGPNGVAKNSFEFENIDNDTNYLTLIPIVSDEAHTNRIMSEDITRDNIKLKQSEAGSVIIKNINITEKSMAVEYETKGVVPFASGFQLLDKDNKVIDLGGLIEEKFNRKTGIHTLTKTFSNSTPEKISQISRIGLYNDSFKLNYDQQIKIPLK